MTLRPMTADELRLAALRPTQGDGHTCPRCRLVNTTGRTVCSGCGLVL